MIGGCVRSDTCREKLKGQTDRQADIPTERQTGSHTERQTGRQADIPRDRQAGRHTD